MRAIEESIDTFPIMNKLVHSDLLWKTNSYPLDKDVIVGVTFCLNGDVEDIRTWRINDTRKTIRVIIQSGTKKTIPFRFFMLEILLSGK